MSELPEDIEAVISHLAAHIMTLSLFTRNLSMFSIGLSMSLVVLPQMPTSAQGLKLPDRGAPSSTTSGGTRSSCVESPKSLYALIPERSMGFTAAATPNLMVYMPQTKAKTMEFVLRDKDDNELYRATLPVPAQAGIVSLQLPAGQPLPALEVGKDYHWYVALICKPGDRREDVFVDAWIQRVNATSVLQGKLDKATVDERPGIYAKAGIWYEALTTLAELRRTRPQDPVIAANWKELLTSVGLSDMVNEPVLDSAAATAQTAR